MADHAPRAAVLAALFLATPVAALAAAVALAAGGGLLGALSVYVGAGMATLIAAAVGVALPWRRVARRARRWAAQGLATPAQVFGR